MTMQDPPDPYALPPSILDAYNGWLAEQQRIQFEQERADRRQAASEAARRQMLDLQQQQIDPRYIDANGMIDEQQAMLDLQMAQLNPRYADMARVQAAEKALLASRRSLLGIQRNQLGERTLEFAALRRAQDDVGNQIDVARMRTQQQAFDPRYGMAGLQVQEIQRPLEGEAPTNLPPGVRYALETDAQRQGRLIERNDVTRGLALERGQQGVAGQQLDLGGVQLDVRGRDAARDKALALAGFRLDRAGLTVNRNDLARKKLLDQANLNIGFAGLIG